MSGKSLKILLIEDNPGDVRLIREMLAEARDAQFKLEHTDRLSSGMARLAGGDIDLTLLDLSLPDSDGLDTFIKVNAEVSEVPVVLLTGLDDETLAYEAIQAGAQDYLVKGQFESDSLERTIRYAIERQRLAERRKAEQALQDSEERFRRVITSITDHVYAYEVAADGQRFVQYLSPNIEEFTGYPIENFIVDWSFWPTVVIHADDREAATGQAERLAQGEVSQMEYRLVRANGEVIWVRDSARVEITPTAKIIYGVVSNITERKQYEHGLEVIVTMITALRAAITRAEMLPIILDTLLDLLSVDGTALDMYDPLNGETVLELARGAWVNAVGLRTPLGEGISGHVLSTDQIYFTNQAQNDPHVADPDLLGGLQAMACVPLIDQEQPIGTLWIGRKYEITPGDIQLLNPIGDIVANALHRAILLEELQRSNKALTQERISLAERVEERTAELSAANAELARAARLKDEFLANMSHELRTPLNAILGMSEVLRSNVYGLLNEEQLRALNHIEDGGRHLLELVNDILDLSKIEADKLDLVIGPIQVDDLCQASLLFIKQMAQKKRIKVLSTLDDSVETLYADQRRLKQILVNLLNNAVKFTPEEGQVGLEVKGDSIQHVVHFTVWDTGIGIPQKDMDRLFQPFVQLDSSLNRHYEGTGLGLSLVSRLAKMHNGKVTVQSEVGAGSRFTVSLPWQNERKRAEEQGGKKTEEISNLLPNTPAPKQSYTILLAEDNETNIIMMRDILRSKGYQIIIARNGLETIEQAKKTRPDVILMDIQMPVLDGLEATRRIRANTRLATIPIIALTALVMPGDRERCLAAGANEYLSKPINSQELVETIEAQLQGGKKRHTEG